jgi:hypothetical protein
MNSISVRALLLRGMLAGLVAGALAMVVGHLLGEPPVDAAIAFEDASHSHGHGGEELVSRTMQSTAGLATGVLVFGVAIGGIAALAFCVALGRVSHFGPRATAALLSLGALLTVYVVPFLKYPPNPPAVGDSDTIGQRTALYFLMILLSVLLAVAAVILGKRLAVRLGNWNATVVASAAFITAAALAFVFLPSFSEVPKGFPATVVWEFRMATLAIQVTLWTGFGLVFGHLAERLLAPKSEPAAEGSGNSPAARAAAAAS